MSIGRTLMHYNNGGVASAEYPVGNDYKPARAVSLSRDVVVVSTISTLSLGLHSARREIIRTPRYFATRTVLAYRKPFNPFLRTLAKVLTNPRKRTFDAI